MPVGVLVAVFALVGVIVGVGVVAVRVGDDVGVAVLVNAEVTLGLTVRVGVEGMLG